MSFGTTKTERVDRCLDWRVDRREEQGVEEEEAVVVNGELQNHHVMEKSTQNHHQNCKPKITAIIKLK